MFLTEQGYKKDIFEAWENEDKTFFPTRATTIIKDVIKRENLVIVTGHKGSGKSVIAQHIALEYRRMGWDVNPVHSIEKMLDYYTFNTCEKDKTLFILHDPFGKENFEEKLYSSWKTNEDWLKLVLKKVKVLLTCRYLILMHKTISGFLKDMRKIITIDDNFCKLRDDEKMKIFKMHTPDREFTKNEWEKLFECEMYFPLLCKEFAQLSNTITNFRDISRFFTKPENTIRSEIESFKRNDMVKYCALVSLVLFNDNVSIEQLRSDKERFSECWRLSCTAEIKPFDLIYNLKLLEGHFVNYIDCTYRFKNNIIMEVTALMIASDFPKETIRCADLSFLRNRVRVDTVFQSEREIVLENHEHIEELVNRLCCGLFSERLIEVVLNPCLGVKQLAGRFQEKIKHDLKSSQLVLKKIKLKIGKCEFHSEVSKMTEALINFVNEGTEISPLVAMIVFRHNQLSKFCLDILMQSQKELKDNNLLSALCCNESIDIFDYFQKNIMENEIWHGNNPVHIASFYHNVRLLSKLVDLGVDLNRKNKWSLTPLHLAVNNMNVKEFSNSKIASSCTEGILNEALKEKCLNTINFLVQKGADINLCSTNKESPLFVACKNGDEYIAIHLIKTGADINMYTNNGTSPLYVACQNGHVSTVNSLLAKGAKVNLCNKRKNSPLYAACEKGHVTIVNSLLTKGANINVCNGDGASPLYAACQHGHFEIVNILLKHKAEVNRSTNDKICPLQAACKNGSIDIMELLMKSGAYVNFSFITDLTKNSFYAGCEHENLRIVKKLLNRCTKVDFQGKNAKHTLYLACINGHYGIANLLLGEGVCLTPAEIEQTLLEACPNGYDSIVKLLIQNGANINFSSEIKGKLLIKACEDGNEPFVRCLLDMNAEVNFCTKDGISPIYVACKIGHFRIVDLLLKKGADVNSSLKDGTRPLKAAQSQRHDHIISLLLDKHAARTYSCPAE